MIRSGAAILPYGRQSIDESDIEAVARVLRSDWLTTGPEVEAFETSFATATGANHAVSCSSGTAALHLSMIALELTNEDRVVVPSVTFLATANAVRYTGAEVIFADVDADTGLMTPESLESALATTNGSVRAIVPVHMAGQVADLDGLSEIASKSGAEIVEDACHALGGKDAKGRQVGSCELGVMASFSLHPVKTITCGEGGVVTTSDARLADSMRRARSHGMNREVFTSCDQAHGTDGSVNPWYYEMPEPGFNYRLSDIHAALGRSQLAKLPRFVRRRAALVALYDRLISELAPEVRPAKRRPGQFSWHLYPVLIDFSAVGMDRGEFMRRLRELGIGSQVHYFPVHRQPYYRERYGDIHLPGADSWYDRTLSLPLFPDMTDDDVHRVVEALKRIVHGS